MIIAVLCPGPSLPASWAARKREPGFTIGVNAGIDFKRCDWWCAGDWLSFTLAKQGPLVGIASQRECLRALRAGTVAGAVAMPADYQEIAWEDLPGSTLYSGVTALALAVRLGAAEIDVYGDDKEGKLDYAGRDETPGRYPSRWAQEKQLLSILMHDLLDPNQIKVTWIKAAPQAP